MIFPALSCHDLLKERLAGGPKTGVVHSVFRHVVNLYFAEDDFEDFLVCLAAKSVDDAPFTLRADFGGYNDSLDALVAKGIAVAASPMGIELGRHVFVDWRQAVLWHPVLPVLNTGSPTVGSNLSALGHALAAAGEKCGFVGLFGKQPLDLFQQALADRSRALLGALVARNPKDIAEAAFPLLGLGPGLTPSGDDFLLGLMACLSLAGHPDQEVLPVLQSIVTQGKAQTNLISYAALFHAAQGQVRACICALLQALAGAEPADVLPGAIRQVMEIGGTSGCDICAGIYAGLALALPGGGWLGGL